MRALLFGGGCEATGWLGNFAPGLLESGEPEMRTNLIREPYRGSADWVMDEQLSELEQSANARHQHSADQSSTVAALTVAVTAAIRTLSKRDPDFGPDFIQLLTTLTAALPKHECTQEVLMALRVAAGQR
jgi:hypothetical protein